jgi:hypothetical protein
VLHVCEADGVGVSEVDVEEEDCVVGTTTTPVEEEALDADVEVEGWTKVTDVATATPIEWSVPIAASTVIHHLHPTPEQLYPGRQQPPFGDSGQLV